MYFYSISPEKERLEELNFKDRPKQQIAVCSPDKGFLNAFVDARKDNEMHPEYDRIK